MLNQCVTRFSIAILPTNASYTCRLGQRELCMSFKDRWHHDKARKLARKTKKAGDPQALIMGIAWYTEEEWKKLTEVVPDRAELDDTNQQWETKANETFQMLKDEGINAVRVMVKMAELQAWCQSHGHPIDGEIRAEYVNHVLRFQYEIGKS